MITDEGAVTFHVASGEAFGIDGLADVPDLRPSPMHGSDQGSASASRFSRYTGGRMFTISQDRKSRSPPPESRFPVAESRLS